MSRPAPEHARPPTSVYGSARSDRHAAGGQTWWYEGRPGGHAGPHGNDRLRSERGDRDRFRDYDQRELDGTRKRARDYDDDYQRNYEGYDHGRGRGGGGGGYHDRRSYDLRGRDRNRNYDRRRADDNEYERSYSSYLHRYRYERSDSSYQLSNQPYGGAHHNLPPPLARDYDDRHGGGIAYNYAANPLRQHSEDSPPPRGGGY